FCPTSYTLARHLSICSVLLLFLFSCRLLRGRHPRAYLHSDHLSSTCTPPMHSLPNETMPVLQYSREDNRLSCAATDRKKRLTFLRIAAINCDRFSFVIIRADHDFHFAVAVQIQRRDHFVSVRRVEAPLFLCGLRIRLGIKFSFDQLRFHFSSDHAPQQHHRITCGWRSHWHAVVFPEIVCRAD